MRIVVLSSHFGRAAEIRQAIAGVGDVHVSILITNEPSRPAWLHWSRQLAVAAAALARRPAATIRALASTRGTARRLHDEGTLAWLAGRAPDVGIHDLDVIYRRPLLDTFRLGVLNAHIGLLPRYRGRSVMEWSLLHGDPTGVTVFFMDEGIDTGARIVLRREIAAHGTDVINAKEDLFAAARNLFPDAVAALVNDDRAVEYEQRLDEGTRFYVMSQLFTGVVATLLEQSRAAPPRDSAGANMMLATS
jgi:folate-dependent phosphoribosylglycinamide formyltransferase PurN